MVVVTIDEDAGMVVQRCTYFRDQYLPLLVCTMLVILDRFGDRVMRFQHIHI